jgi:asparagine synthase (glutamine-hydrolysing)
MNDWPVPRAFKKLGLNGLRLAGRDGTFSYERLRRAASGELIFWNGNEMFTDAQKMRLLSSRLCDRFRNSTSYEAIEPIHERFRQKAWQKSYLHWMTYMDLNLHTSEHHLMRSDKMMMAAGHETRLPFLDHELVELVLSIPEEVHTRNGKLNKPILEKIASELVPNGLIERTQGDHGFPYAWLFGRLGDLARQILDEFCRQTDYLDHPRVLGLIDEMRVKRDVHLARQCWCLLTFALWWNRFIGRDAA